MTTTGHDNATRSPSPRLLHLMELEGFEKTLVWRQSGPCDSGEGFKEGNEKKAKTAAERQAEQTIRDEDVGWKRCYAKAPDDADARDLVAIVAKAIASPIVRRAVRIAVTRPQTVFVGERVHRLLGIRRWIVRWLMGTIDHSVSTVN
jgi:hypothetical protein